jgi:hypothetical protein
MSKRTPYEVLGITTDASEDDVPQAFRNLAQIYHPDRFDGASPAVLAEVMRRMQEVKCCIPGTGGTSGQDGLLGHSRLDEPTTGRAHTAASRFRYSSPMESRGAAG